METRTMLFLGCFTSFLVLACIDAEDPSSDPVGTVPRAVGVGLAVTQPVAIQPVDVLTHHNDVARTGLNSHESVLNPFDVQNQLGKLYSYSVVGQVYAQPLYVSNVAIPGQGVHNVVFIAPEEDRVYAFDADRPIQLWPAKNFTSPNVLPVSNANATGDMPPQLPRRHLQPDIGITGTTVIDQASGTLYVVAYTQEWNGTSWGIVKLTGRAVP
jgi:hypothetical protein